MMNLVYLTTKKKKGKKIMKSYLHLLSLLALLAMGNNADIDQILEENNNTIVESESSQDKVDNLSDEKTSLAEWKVVVKQVEGLRIYNAQKRAQIKAQEERLLVLENQTKEIDTTKRLIPGVMTNIALRLEKDIKDNAPFLIDVRLGRVNQVLDILVDPTVTESERVRQVLEAVNIEREYGRTIETYEDAIVLDGEEKVVNILRLDALPFYIS